MLGWEMGVGVGLGLGNGISTLYVTLPYSSKSTPKVYHAIKAMKVSKADRMFGKEHQNWSFVRSNSSKYVIP